MLDSLDRDRVQFSRDELLLMIQVNQCCVSFSFHTPGTRIERSSHRSLGK